MLDDKYIKPPGTLVDNLPHPYFGQHKSVEIAIFNDHRYAFFFWNKWNKWNIEINEERPPCLVSLDWHQDLVFPDNYEKNILDKLDLNQNKDVALFSWFDLRSLNDTHILAAAYLNLIGNIYVHCRQGTFEDEFFTDKFGNPHVIKKFKEFEEMESYLLTSNESNVFFDIDLDFFTIDNPLNGKGKKFTYLKRNEIIEMLSSDRKLITWIFERLKGFTIAVEPEHTGGLLKADRLLNLINQIYFKPELFVNYAWQWDKHTNWKHLKKGNTNGKK